MPRRREPGQDTHVFKILQKHSPQQLGKVGASADRENAAGLHDMVVREHSGAQVGQQEDLNGVFGRVGRLASIPDVVVVGRVAEEDASFTSSGWAG